jgi:hypothetical protein
MELLWYFLSGMFYFNALPHLVKGITGQEHMTPFKRVSSPVLNVVWSFINFTIAFYLAGMASGNGGFISPWEVGMSDTTLIAFGAGGFFISAYLANFWSNPKARLPWHKD